MLVWVLSFGAVDRVGIECTGTYGADLHRYLQAAGITVLEVTAPDKSDRRRRGKDDNFDAINAAHAAFAGVRTVSPKSRDGMPVKSSTAYAEGILRLGKPNRPLTVRRASRAASSRRSPGPTGCAEPGCVQIFVPLLIRCGWKCFKSSGVTASGDRPSQEANRLQARKWLVCDAGPKLRANISAVMRARRGAKQDAEWSWDNPLSTQAESPRSTAHTRPRKPRNKSRFCATPATQSPYRGAI